MSIFTISVSLKMQTILQLKASFNRRQSIRISRPIFHDFFFNYEFFNNKKFKKIQENISTAVQPEMYDKFIRNSTSCYTEATIFSEALSINAHGESDELSIDWSDL